MPERRALCRTEQSSTWWRRGHRSKFSGSFLQPHLARRVQGPRAPWATGSDAAAAGTCPGARPLLTPHRLFAVPAFPRGPGLRPGSLPPHAGGPPAPSSPRQPRPGAGRRAVCNGQAAFPAGLAWPLRQLPSRRPPLGKGVPILSGWVSGGPAPGCCAAGPPDSARASTAARPRGGLGWWLQTFRLRRVMAEGRRGGDGEAVAVPTDPHGLGATPASLPFAALRGVLPFCLPGAHGCLWQPSPAHRWVGALRFRDIEEQKCIGVWSPVGNSVPSQRRVKGRLLAPGPSLPDPTWSSQHVAARSSGVSIIAITVLSLAFARRGGGPGTLPFSGRQHNTGARGERLAWRLPAVPEPGLCGHRGCASGSPPGGGGGGGGDHVASS